MYDLWKSYLRDFAGVNYFVLPHLSKQGHFNWLLTLPHAESDGCGHAGTLQQTTSTYGLDIGAAHSTGVGTADVEIKNAEDLPVFSVDVGLIRSRNGQRPNRPKPGHNLYSIESMKPQDALATMRVRKDQLHLSIGGAPLSAPLRHSVFHCVRSSVRHSVFHSVRSTVGC